MILDSESLDNQADGQAPRHIAAMREVEYGRSPDLLPLRIMRDERRLD